MQQAELYGAIGQLSAEAAATRKAMEAAYKTVDDVHPFMQFSKFKAIRHLIHSGAIDEAENLLRECLAFIREHGYLPPVELIEITRYFAESVQNKDPKLAEDLCRQALDLTRNSLSRPKAAATADYRGALATAVAALGSLLTKLGRGAEADPLYRDTLRLLGEYKDQFHMMWLMNEFAEAKERQSNFAVSEQLFRECLVLTKFVEEDTARVNWISRLSYRLADCLLKQKKLAEAEQMYQKVVVLDDRDWAPLAKPKLTELAADRIK